MSYVYFTQLGKVWLRSRVFELSIGRSRYHTREDTLSIYSGKDTVWGRVDSITTFWVPVTRPSQSSRRTSTVPVFHRLYPSPFRSTNLVKLFCRSPSWRSLPFSCRRHHPDWTQGLYRDPVTEVVGFGVKEGDILPRYFRVRRTHSRVKFLH